MGDASSPMNDALTPLERALVAALVAAIVKELRATGSPPLRQPAA